MAHFAKISEENKVLTVLAVDDKDIKNNEGIETEAVGQEYLEIHNNWPRHLWIQTSYNTYANQHIKGGTPFRGNYAGIGYIWDAENQIFWPKKPYASWVKNTSEARWQSPIGNAPNLTSEQISQNEAGTHDWCYKWNENNQSWYLTNQLT